MESVGRLREEAGSGRPRQVTPSKFSIQTQDYSMAFCSIPKWTIFYLDRLRLKDETSESQRGLESRILSSIV